MNIGIKFPPRTDRKNKKETLFWAALEFIEHKNNYKREKWREGVKVHNVIGACLLQLSTKGTTASIEFDADIDFSGFYSL